MNNLAKEDKLKIMLQEVEKHNIKATEVSKATGLNQSGLDRIFSGKVKSPNHTTINLVLDYIANKIVGTKYQSSQVNESIADYGIAKITKDKFVPYYDIEFSGRSLTNFDDVKESISFYVDYEPLNDCTAFIPYAGDSMLPKYKSGDALGVKEISNFDVILWGESHFVITNEKANSIKTVKNIHQHQDQNKIILRSINPDYLGDTVIEKDHISSMFIVKGKVELNQI